MGIGSRLPMPSLALKLARAALRLMPYRNVKNRLIDRSFLKRLPFAENSLDVVTRDGFTITVDPRDMLGRHLYLMGEFEQGVCDLLVQAAEPGDVMWDIGANIGLMSCAFLHRVPHGRVLAVEPLPDIHSRLAHNLKRVGGSAESGGGAAATCRFVLVQAAVSDHQGEATLQRVEGHLGASGIVEKPDPTRPVEVTTLRTGEDLEALQPRAWASEGRTPPQVIKIDVEGHELAVLRGIRGVIQRHRPRMILFEHLSPDRALPPEILGFFGAEHGVDYSIFQLMRDWSRTWLVPYEGARGSPLVRTDDFVAFPRERMGDLRQLLSRWWA